MKLLIKNTNTQYGIIAILMHWLMAFGIFFLFGLGLYMVELSYYDAWYKGSLDLHKSIGLLIFFLYCFRLIWRFLNTQPNPLSTDTPFKKFEHIAAHWAHISLYIILLLLMSSGYLISTADGRGISFFNLFDVPAIPELIDNQEDIAGEIHFILAWSLIVLAAIHALAAIKHHFIDKDDTLKRMNPINRNLISHDENMEK